MNDLVNNNETITEYIEGGCPCGFHQALRGLSTYDVYITYLKETRPSAEHSTINQTTCTWEFERIPQATQPALSFGKQDEFYKEREHFFKHLRALHGLEPHPDDETRASSSVEPQAHQESTTIRKLLFSVKQNRHGGRNVGGV